MYFDVAGAENTERALEIVAREAERRGIRFVVVASTTGDVAKRAVERFRGKGVRLVVVTHNTGFSTPGQQQFSEEARRLVLDSGGVVVTGTMALRGVGKAIRSSTGFSQEDLVANVLRLFCQGVKVCVEITMMAADAGAIPPEDVIAVAGTGRGSDTALLIRAASSNALFDLKIREVLAKPRDF